MKNKGYAKFERERGGGGWWGIRCIMENVKRRVLKDVLLYLGISERGWEKNVIAISLPTQHLGVLTNSRLNVCAFQIELEFGNDALGATERTNKNLNPHGWWGGP